MTNKKKNKKWLKVLFIKIYRINQKTVKWRI